MAPTMSTTEHHRRFTGNGDGDIDHPVDALGRVRWNAPLGERSITRADGDDSPIGFKGHAAMFNERTLIGSKRWGFLEQIARGAFTKTIAEADVRLLQNHDPSLLLARNKAGNLRLSEDKVGLAADADMVPTTFARDLAMLLETPEGGERGTIDQMSFAFEPTAWTRETVVDDDGVERDLITLTEVRLFDVAIVTYPAYESTDAGLRSAAFAQMARELGADPAELLRTFSQGQPLLPDLSSVSRSGTDGEEHNEPPEGTRDQDQPAQTTGTPNHQLRARALRSRMAQTKEIL